MKIIKSILLYLTGVFVVLAVFGFLMGGSHSELTVYLYLFKPSFTGFFPFLVYYLLLVMIFSSNFELERREKTSWIIVFMPLVVNAVFLVMLALFKGGFNANWYGWFLIGGLLYGGMTVGSLFFANIFYERFQHLRIKSNSH